MAKDPYRYFRVEANELQDQLGKGVLELDRGGAAPPVMASLLRLAHTLKGAARVVKQREIADQAHAIEEALTPFRDSPGSVPREAIEAALAALDEISARVMSLDTPPPAPGPVSAPVSAQAPAVAEAPARDVDEVETLLETLSAANTQLATLRRGTETLLRGRRQAQRLHEQADASGTGRGPANGAWHDSIADLRLEMDRAGRQLGEGIEQLAREIADARESAERLRLVPASRMFLSLERAARDGALQLGKQVEFQARGGSVRLDAQVFSAMQGALVQAVRNAVAHGVEAPAVREAAGKSPRGRIVIDVRQRGHQVAFDCHDDGRGVDIEAVRSALERKGMPPAEATALDQQGILDLLLSGGLSTSNSVTQLSGRGIGLDLVRDTAVRLHGSVGIRTEPGAGTHIEVIVPTSLAAVDALIVESAGRNVAIPLDAVKRTLRVTPADVAPSASGASILYEGQIIPFAPLERALQSGAARRPVNRTWSALVVQGATALAAVGVERLNGTQNLVMRPLPAMAPCDALVAGASLDAEGHPQLILDPAALVERILSAGPERKEEPAERAPILVIDDSLTTRMLEQSILESAGYEVDLAVSGEDGLQRARSRRYALFLVDVEMPGMDGFTFIEHVRADPDLRDTPAVLVTSLSSPEHRQRGREAGARGHIVKGEFDQSELLSTIRSLVRTG